METENVEVMTIDNQLLTPEQLVDYWKDIDVADMPLKEKKAKYQVVISKSQAVKREMQANFNKSIKPLLDLESMAKDFKKSVVDELNEEWRSDENVAQRLSKLAEKYGLEAGTDGTSEKFAMDPKLWTPSDNPSSKIKDLIIDMQRRETQQLQEKVVQTSENADVDSTKLLNAIESIVEAYPGVKVVHSPFTHKIIVEY